jgi:3-methyladenine DNA glycosylase AlkD
MTAREILEQLKGLGNEGYKKVIRNHGVQEPFFGVKIEELKKIQKRVKKDYQLALDLYDTGNYDAMYLAGLIADEAKMTKKDLQHWLAKAKSRPLRQWTVPWVAAESNHGLELALEWIESKKEEVAMAGWATLANLVALNEDSELDLDMLAELLERVRKSIHQQPNFVRYTMMSFVIALGSYVRDFTAAAIKAGEEIGKVSVDMGDTSCKVPYAPDYIRKVKERGSIGKKRKTVRC